MPGHVIFALTDRQAAILYAIAKAGELDRQRLTERVRRTLNALVARGLVAQPGQAYVLTDAGELAARLAARLAIPRAENEG